MLIKKQNKNFETQAGFTLVELAIVMIIVGLILGSIATGLRVWKENYAHNTVKKNINNATLAATLFFGQVGRYPCPADPGLEPGDANYGAEDCTLPTIPGENPTNDPVYVGVLPLYGFDDAAGDPTADRIELRYLLPRVTEKGNNISDPWNRNFVYAVTQSLTVASDGDPMTLGDFDHSRGSIKVRDEFNNDTGGTNSNAHFIILSRGQDSDCVNGAGAPLPPTAPIPPTTIATPERENCDNDAEFSIALQSRGAGDAYYDDYLRLRRSVSTGIWAPVTGSSDLYPIPSGKVFIGDAENYQAEPPAVLDLKLDVDGNIIVDERIAASEICDDANKTNCFIPESLFDLDCPSAGEYIKGVSINAGGRLEADCQPLEFVPSQEICPNGQRLNGIYTDGTNAICE